MDAVGKCWCATLAGLACALHVRMRVWSGVFFSVYWGLCHDRYVLQQLGPGNYGALLLHTSLASLNEGVVPLFLWTYLGLGFMDI